MDHNSWRKTIIDEMKRAETYKPFFNSVINTLADILSARDKAKEQFEKTGGAAIVKHTNKGGATNLEQNPALRLMNDLNRDALAYWRELGLTPKGLKTINDGAMKEEKEDALTKALKELG